MNQRFKFILLFTFLLAGFRLSSQEPLVSIQLHQPQFNLYWGFNNELQVSVSGIPANEISLRSDDLLISGENGFYTLKVKRGVKLGKVEIVHNDKPIRSFEFQSMPLPSAKLYLSYYESGQGANMKSILDNPCFNIKMSDPNVKADFFVESYTLIISKFGPGGEPVKIKDFKEKGNCLTPEIISFLESKNFKGEMITAVVNYKGPDGIVRKGGIVLTLPDNIIAELDIERKKVADKDEELQQKAQILIEQDSVLSSQQAEMEQQQELLNQNLNEIADQQQQMEEQKSILDNQLIQIDNQRNLLYIFIIIVLIVSALLFIAYRNYRQKKSAMNEVVEQKEKVEEAHHELEEKNQEILDSIIYAKRIQTAILPPPKLVKEYLNDSFVLYKPKDVVAGDFYWMEPQNGRILFAAADCTGHGVPGAMVSVICNNGLNRAVREFGLSDPADILSKTRDLVIAEFEKSEEEVKDGMDIALCSLEGNKVKYAGAHNPLWIIRKGVTEIEEIKADKQPIGKFASSTAFSSHKIELGHGDTFYLFTDGFADQFGGDKGKKFKAANFKKLLLSIQGETMDRQKELIDEAFENWRGSLEQLDDVCVIGVRV